MQLLVTSHEDNLVTLDHFLLLLWYSEYKLWSSVLEYTIFFIKHINGKAILQLLVQNMNKSVASTCVYISFYCQSKIF